MKIEGSHPVKASRERVYQSLIDPAVLQRCIPGCEKLERTSEDAYSLTIRTGVGSIKGVFSGSVRLTDLRAPEHYRIVVEGKGAPGFLKGAGDFELESQGQTTLLKYSGDVQVGGTIASVGQRMIQASAKMMAAQFFTALELEAATAAGEAPPEHGFFRTALRWFSGWLRRVFGGR
jgi:carbon monoxide dehydrogenase subunit G